MRHRPIVSLLLFILVLVSVEIPAWGQDAHGPLVRSSLSADGEITVGQPVTLTVDLLVPTWLTGGPRYPEIEVADAVVIFLDRGGFNLSERIAGETWSGLHREYLIYALRPGRFEISGEAVIVRYAVDGRPSPPTSVPIPAAGFSATVPEAAAGLDYFVSASSFDLSASWDRPVADLEVGQSLTRAVTMKAVDSFSMMLPPLEFAPLEGVAVYPDAPRLADSGGERGAARESRREERVTYLFQEPGVYTLPPIEISWWDAADGLLQQADLPAVELRVAPNPDLEAEIALPPEPTTKEAGGVSRGRRHLVPWISWGLAVVGLGWMGWRWWRARWPGLRDSLAARRRRREESEAAYFGRFRDACRSADPARAYRDLVSWLDRTAADLGAAKLAVFVERSQDSQLAREVAQVERDLFAAGSTSSKSGPQPWQGGDLYKRVALARRKLSGGGRSAPPATEVLPPLNPRFEEERP